MYGLVNKAIEDMICAHFSEDTWEAIKVRAGLEDIDYFMSMEGYPDDVTHKLVRATCEILNMSADEVLQAFGRYWVKYTANEGYGEMMNSAGDNLPEFLKNLNNLHARVGLSFPQLTPPEFDCTDKAENTIELQYRSTREGLAPMVIGLIEGLGERFDTKVEIEQMQTREAGCDHDTFAVKYDSGFAS